MNRNQIICNEKRKRKSSQVHASPASEVLNAGDDFADHVVIVGDEEHRAELAAWGAHLITCSFGCVDHRNNRGELQIDHKVDMAVDLIP